MFPTMFKPEECTSLLEVTGEVSFDPRRFNFHERVRERDWMKWRELNFTRLHHLSVFVPESRQIDFNCQWWLFNDVFTTSKASSYCLNSAQTQHRKKKKKKKSVTKVKQQRADQKRRWKMAACLLGKLHITVPDDLIVCGTNTADVNCSCYKSTTVNQW